MNESAIGRWFARLSDRERKLVVGGGLMISMAMLILTGLLVSRRVSDLEEQVAGNAESLKEVLDLAPAYLDNRREERAIDEQLKRAGASSLQSTLLGIAKEVQFERKYTEGGTSTARLSDFVKFSNATEVLADLTKKTGRKKRRKKKKEAKGEKQVFLSSIEVVFDRIPDTALYQFMAKVESHPEALFATSLDISRESPNHQHFRAKMRVGQFKYGNEG